MRKLFALTAIAAASLAVPAEAAVTVDFAEVGPNVVATTSGSLDTTGLTLESTSGYGAGVNSGLAAFDSTSGTANAYSGLTGPTNFGTGNTFSLATGVGSFFGLYGASGLVRLPVGYVSGTTFSALTTFAGQTLADLGLTPGTYVYSAPNDTVTVNIGVGVPAAVPEPATWAMMLLGFGAIGFTMRRRRTAALATA